MTSIVERKYKNIRLVPVHPDETVSAHAETSYLLASPWASGCPAVNIKNDNQKSEVSPCAPGLTYSCQP